ncbi:glycosyltransferase [Arthrobacter sp. GCM10027362]|uniref:glycosyltransferase n=1 Tax=Arthrobacter sp. GCM10027362 TaxID=3273379 RepID=UPI0036434437
MKICHIVAYVSSDGAYGGPTTVAFAQCQALQAGHEVTLLAGWDGKAQAGGTDGIRRIYKRAFRPLSSFGSLFSPGLLWWLLRNGRSFDLCHIHLARDFTVMPAALLCRLLSVPYVIQTHGMIRTPSGLAGRAYDRFLTFPALRGARRSFYLTTEEHTDLSAMPGHPPFEQVRNAVPVPPVPSRPAGPAERVNVLYCSRMHSRKRPALFVDMALELEERAAAAFGFSMVGPDGGELRRVEDAIAAAPAAVQLTYDGAVPPEAVARILGETDILVLPSINEPFPMIVLEALSMAVPVVVDSTSGLAGILADRPGARVVDSTPKSLADAVQDLSKDLAAEREAARSIAHEEFSLRRLARQLDAAYADSLPPAAAQRS